jgi:hypothetical protein
MVKVLAVLYDGGQHAKDVCFPIFLLQLGFLSLFCQLPLMVVDSTSNTSTSTDNHNHLPTHHLSTLVDLKRGEMVSLHENQPLPA